MILSLILGENQTKIAVINKNFELVSMREATPPSGTSAEAHALLLCREIASRESIRKEDIEYISLAVCDSVRDSNRIAGALKNSLGIPVRATSYSAALALGEAYLNANDVSSIILLDIGDKIDSAVIIDGKPLLDYTKADGGLGHTVISYGGYHCSCGRSGCLEAYLTPCGIRRIAAESGMPNAESAELSDIFDAADSGDSAAIAAKEAYAAHLACGLTNIINLFQPHELVRMGTLCDLGDLLMKPLMEIVLREQYTRHSPNKCNVRFSASDSRTALVGAALLGR